MEHFPRFTQRGAGARVRILVDVEVPVDHGHDGQGGGLHRSNAVHRIRPRATTTGRPRSNAAHPDEIFEAAAQLQRSRTVEENRRNARVEVRRVGGVTANVVEIGPRSVAPAQAVREDARAYHTGYGYAQEPLRDRRTHFVEQVQNAAYSRRAIAPLPQHQQTPRHQPLHLSHISERSNESADAIYRNVLAGSVSFGTYQAAQDQQRSRQQSGGYRGYNGSRRR